MNKKPYIYTISEDAYEDTVHERILLYSFVRQLAHLTKKAETVEDFFRLKEAAAIYGAQAEGLFESWDIPGRYLVDGGPADLDGIKELELLDYGGDEPGGDTEDAENFEDGPEPDGDIFLISGGSFRLLVADLYDLYCRYFGLAGKLAAAEDEKAFLKLKKNASGYERLMKRLCKRWGVPCDGEPWAYDTMEERIRESRLTPACPVREGTFHE